MSNKPEQAQIRTDDAEQLHPVLLRALQSGLAKTMEDTYEYKPYAHFAGITEEEVGALRDWAEALTGMPAVLLTSMDGDRIVAFPGCHCDKCAHIRDNYIPVASDTVLKAIMHYVRVMEQMETAEQATTRIVGRPLSRLDKN